MNRMVMAVVCVALGGCLGASDDGGPVVPPPEIEEPMPAPSCGESNGLCRKVCFGQCDDEQDFSGECSGTCSGACCSAVE